MRTGRKVKILLIFLVIIFAAVGASASLTTGDRGDQVIRLQQKLKEYGYLKGAADGIFGAKTKAAVKYFQRKNGLFPDGIAGKATFAALGLVPSAEAGKQENEIYTLARLVHGEARGEVYTGKVAVAAVVLNRVKSASFPNTISGVIFQSGAFDCVADGQIWLTPDSDSIRAARDAMNGWDPTYGCLYYYNPATATNRWIRSREVRLTIGAHVFAI